MKEEKDLIIFDVQSVKDEQRQHEGSRNVVCWYPLSSPGQYLVHSPLIAGAGWTGYGMFDGSYYAGIFQYIPIGGALDGVIGVHTGYRMNDTTLHISGKNQRSTGGEFEVYWRPRFPEQVNLADFSYIEQLIQWVNRIYNAIGDPGVVDLEYPVCP